MQMWTANALWGIYRDEWLGNIEYLLFISCNYMQFITNREFFAIFLEDVLRSCQLASCLDKLRMQHLKFLICPQIFSFSFNFDSNNW